MFKLRTWLYELGYNTARKEILKELEMAILYYDTQTRVEVERLRNQKSADSRVRNDPNRALFADGAKALRTFKQKITGEPDQVLMDEMLQERFDGRI